EIAVARLGGMHEERRRAGGGERGRDLARHVARLADAGHDHAAVALEHHAHCGNERRCEPCGERLDRLRLDREHVPRKRERTLRIERRGGCCLGCVMHLGADGSAGLMCDGGHRGEYNVAPLMLSWRTTSPATN